MERAKNNRNSDIDSWGCSTSNAEVSYTSSNILLAESNKNKLQDRWTRKQTDQDIDFKIQELCFKDRIA